MTINIHKVRLVLLLGIVGLIVAGAAQFISQRNGDASAAEPTGTVQESGAAEVDSEIRLSPSGIED